MSLHHEALYPFAESYTNKIPKLLLHGVLKVILSSWTCQLEKQVDWQKHIRNPRSEESPLTTPETPGARVSSDYLTCGMSFL